MQKGKILMCSNVGTHSTKSLQLLQIIVRQRLGESKESGRAMLGDGPFMLYDFPGSLVVVFL